MGALEESSSGGGNSVTFLPILTYILCSQKERDALEGES